ncbi:hypothetical protein prwr041_18560 [Prevotella herbatica]|uniref:Uncharacterized protein n=2 Tax=Prevotella herbatica TaxID=2801997 RepID=A0ABM7NZK8_9BACT|nr:hypothetical protein prwr041_18560 [Prevotella herbatica]
MTYYGTGNDAAEIDKKFHIGTIENYPDLAMVKRILKKDKAKKVTLYPLS